MAKIKIINKLGSSIYVKGALVKIGESYIDKNLFKQIKRYLEIKINSLGGILKEDSNSVILDKGKPSQKKSKSKEELKSGNIKTEKPKEDTKEEPKENTKEEVKEEKTKTSRKKQNKSNSKAK